MFLLICERGQLLHLDFKNTKEVSFDEKESGDMRGR